MYSVHDKFLQCNLSPCSIICIISNTQVYTGSYTTVWQPSKMKGPNNPREFVDWTDKEPKSV